MGVAPIGAVESGHWSGRLRRLHPRFAGAEDAEGEAAGIFKGFDPGDDFEHGIADGGQAVGFVGVGEQFGFDHAGPVGEGEEFHWFAGDLVMGALFDDEAAGDDFLADLLSESGDGAIGVPGDVVEEIEGMTTDREAEQVGFGFESFAAGGLSEGALG